MADRRRPCPGWCNHDPGGMGCDTCAALQVAAYKVTEFWKRVDSSGGPAACWPWTGAKMKDYGLYLWNGRKVGAHELALTFTTGEARHPDLDTCHSCDNPICCNPAHLRFDTRQGNVNDMVSRGRHASGVRNGHAKLTERDVLTIRQRAASGALGSDLAADYGVTPGLVTEIIRGRRWSHVGGPIRTSHGNLRHGRYARNNPRRNQ